MIQKKFIDRNGKTFISMYGKEISFENFDFREEGPIAYGNGQCICYDKDGKGTVIDALGRTYPKEEMDKYKEGLDELAHLHGCIFAGEKNIEKLIKNIDFNLFLDDDFHRAVIKLYAHYQKMEVERCKEAGKKININKIENNPVFKPHNEV